MAANHRVDARRPRHQEVRGSVGRVAVQGSIRKGWNGRGAKAKLARRDYAAKAAMSIRLCGQARRERMRTLLSNTAVLKSCGGPRTRFGSAARDRLEFGNCSAAVRHRAARGVPKCGRNVAGISQASSLTARGPNGSTRFTQGRLPTSSGGYSNATVGIDDLGTSPSLGNPPRNAKNSTGCRALTTFPFDQSTRWKNVVLN